ncbi:MAG: sigma-70 family RNA polymerase sigma factor [Bacteroidia bacterium]
MLSTTTLTLHTDLIDACKRGDRKAQFRLYQLYARAMFNICTRMLPDRAAAEDAMQEAFVNAFGRLDSFEGRSSFGAWLKRIVINKCLSHLQRQRLPFDSLDEHHADLIDESDDEPPADLGPERIQEAIKGLPDGCRIIFTLYQLEGYDHQEISEILGVSVSTSKSQYHRAKSLLRERLSREYAD